jgi:hypothetical protein
VGPLLMMASLTFADSSQGVLAVWSGENTPASDRLGALVLFSGD